MSREPLAQQTEVLPLSVGDRRPAHSPIATSLSPQPTGQHDDEGEMIWT